MRWRRLFFCAGGLLLLFAAGRLYYELTGDFRLNGLQQRLPSNPAWNQEPFPYSLEQEEAEQALLQPYFYLGKGAQSHAFESIDGRYVLKLFKNKHFHLNFLDHWLPQVGPLARYRDAKIQKKRQLMEGVFGGYALADRRWKEGSGLLLVELTTSSRERTEQKRSPRRIVLKDKLGFFREVDLSNYAFVLQRRGEMVSDYLRRQLATGEEGIKGAAAALFALGQLYVEEYCSGIYDRDEGVMHNMGFLEEAGTPGLRAFHLDAGKLTANEQMKQREVAAAQLNRLIEKVDHWLEAEKTPHRQELIQAMIRGSYPILY